MTSTSDKQPIITIVGFLGSGKTTLLKKLAKDFIGNHWQPHIILNDYQNASIDAQHFLEFLSKDQLNALNGSCICCSGINELRQAVNNIPNQPNAVTLIEANGTTDAPTLMEFLGVGLRDFFMPPIQISVIDARHWQKRGLNNDLEANQIQVSSLIVLNFTQELDYQRLETVKEEVKVLNPYAKIMVWEEVDALGLSDLTPTANTIAKIDHLKSHWSSCSIDLPNPMSSDHLKLFLASLPKQILRVKGCTKLDNDETYSFIEKTPGSETSIKPFRGKLLSGPKMITIGPGSDPITLGRLITKSNQPNYGH